MHIYTYLQKIDGWMDRWIDTYARTLSTYTVVEHTYIYTYIHTYTAWKPMEGLLLFRPVCWGIQRRFWSLLGVGLAVQVKG